LPAGFAGLPPDFARDAALAVLSPVGRGAGRLLFADDFPKMVCPPKMIFPKMDDRRLYARRGLLAAALRRVSAFPNAKAACRGGSVSMGFCDQALKIPMVHLHKAADDLFLGV
jgi:hypothetical protein